MGEKKYGMAGEYSQQDIIDALNLLEDVCMASNCSGCPLRAKAHPKGDESNMKICAVVQNVPGYWDIKTKQDFRAFKGDDE